MSLKKKKKEGKEDRASEIAQQVMVLAAKPEDLSLIPGTYTVEE